MAQVIDHETMNIDDLPGIWSPVQWNLTEEERVEELHTQAAASLLYCIDTPEAMLRLLLDECEIERALEPPEGYNPEKQGEWDPNVVSFIFRRPIRLLKMDRLEDCLYAEYHIEGLGDWAVRIEPDHVELNRI